MAINFPTSLDTTAQPSAGQVVDSARIAKLIQMVEALEAKVGADSSAVTSSLDYKVAHASVAGTTTPTIGGFSTIHKGDATSSTGTVGSRLLLSCFIAGKSMTVNNLVCGITGTGTPTLFKLGIYSIDGSQNGTLLMSTANSSASPTTTGMKTIAVGTPTAIVAGSVYAFAVLAVGGTPAVATGNTITFAALADQAPFAGGLLTGQADLPGSFTFAGLSAKTTVLTYGEVS